MKTILACILGLVLAGRVGAEPLVEGRVRLSSGEPAANVQVAIFDLANLQQGVVAHATTDAAGYFVLSAATPTGRTVPQHFALGQNYPNPFNPSTVIPYQLTEAAPVRLEVFNLLGQRLATLVDGMQSAGAHIAAWDATDAAGQAVGAGVYIYRLSSEGRSQSRRMVLVDGQAGVVSIGTAPERQPTVVEADAPVYGLAIAGTGLVAYVDAQFRVGMGPVDIVMEAADGMPRGKVLAGGILGDVDNNNRVNFFDALIVALYSRDSSIAIPNNGDIARGDVDQDGRVTLFDAYLIAAYLDDPSDPSLPAGIGEPIGTDPINLTNHHASDWAPVWSPDGRRIAFQSFRDGNNEIYVMDADGQNQTRLTANDRDDWFHSWSPDGRQIAFHSDRDGNWEIYVMDADGRNQTRLTFNDRDDWHPYWSPDGRRIAFQSFRDGNNEIYVMDADGRNQTRLTFNDHDDRHPYWSPDGRRIAFYSYRDGNNEIYVMDADGQNQTQLTANDSYEWFHFWSPDGRRIAFHSDQDGSREIYVTEVDERNQTRLTFNDDDDISPVWSPDGRRIAFQSFRDGNNEIYVMDADGQNQTRLTANDDDDESPSWSPDGRRIAFYSYRDGNWEIYVITYGDDSAPVEPDRN